MLTNSFLKPLFFLFPLFQFAVSFAQKETCPDVKNGLFYSYPANSTDSWKCERAGDVQTEVNLTNGDTTVYRVKWSANCQYTMNYVSGGRKYNREALALLKQHSLVYVITSTAADYYVATSYLDAATNYPLAVDTMWRSKQKVQVDRLLFKALSATEQRKAKLKDTSSFALLYVYRPKKFICKAEMYVLYGNNTLMGSVDNGSAFVYKISKAAPLRITGQRASYKDYVDIDVRFGQKYYLFCDIRWNADRCSPQLVLIDNEKGERQFAEALN